MRILVVGGAGYIGSHAVRRLLRAGHDVHVFDNLDLGHAWAAPEGRLIIGDLADRAALESALRSAGAEAVMHFAAFASVPESVADPAKYYRNNVVGTLNLLDAMRAAGVRRLVFSSTAAVYGVAEVVPIPEGARSGRSTPTASPSSPSSVPWPTTPPPTASAPRPCATSTPAAPPRMPRSARTTPPRPT